MADCTCPRIDGYRIRRLTCPTHGGERCDDVVHARKIGERFVCVAPACHDMPHRSKDGAWWEPPTRPVEMADARESERQRWADRIDLAVMGLRNGPHPETPDARIMVSVLMEWANRLRFNEPDGNDVPPKGGRS